MPSLWKRTSALLVVALFAVVAATARAADQPPNTFKGHGISFKYPTSWIEIPATFEIQIGAPLWTESIGPAAPVTPPAPVDPSQPQPPATPQPDDPHRPLVALAAYHLSVSVTPKNIGRYKQSIAAAAAQLAAQAHGRVESGPVRVKMARLPGYRFQITATFTDGAQIRSRIVYVFRKKTEYFLNCEYRQDDPLAAEVETGCSQIMQSFRLSS